MQKKATVLLLAGAFAFSAALATTATAAPNYGPSGLGSNLHRRHVMKQATKRAKQGRPVRRSAILWMAGPRSTAWRGR